ncbi:MAG: MFS transporter [Akkermansia sp.]|nr:MFS transporter [Akkermansia sp.]
MALPAQTKYIVGNEACERFSFYGMRSILVAYMTGMLLMSKNEATEVVHLFIACTYLMPLLGAWLADRFLGRYRTIFSISLLYCLGNAVLAMADFAGDAETRKWVLFAGLAIIAVGAGGIKPCVSAFVGDQVPEDEKNGPTMTRLYAAFYWSVNLGSFFSFLVIPWVRQNWGYSWAFGIPGIFMALATLIFWLGRRKYNHVPPTQPEFLRALLTRVFSGAATACARFGGEAVARATNTAIGIAAFIVIAPIVVLLGNWAHGGATQLAALSGASEIISALCGLIALLLYILVLALAGLKLAAATGMKGFLGLAGSMIFNSKEETNARFTGNEQRGARNLARVLVVFLMIIPFWSLYDQTASSWVLQGKEMQSIDLSWGSLRFSFGAEEMQSFNPLLIMIFVPLVTLFVYPCIGRWGAPLKRMGMGILLAGIAYGAVAALQQQIDAGLQLSILWQCIPYFLLTLSEILVSTTGLEYAYTAAGKNLKSIVSSFWLLTSTLGNLLVVFLTSLVNDPASVSAFVLYGCMSLCVGIIFLFVTSRPNFKAEEEED